MPRIQSIDTWRLLIVGNCNGLMQDDPRLAGYNCRQAESAHSAAELLSIDSFEVIVLACTDGAEALDFLGHFASSTYTPALLLLVDQLSSPDLIADVFRHGAHDCIDSRVDGVELGQVLGRAVEETKRRRDALRLTVKLEEENRQLRIKYTEIRRFYQKLCHEIRTPLTAMREFVALVADGVATNKTERQEYLGHALESCDHLSHLVENITDATRVERGKLYLQETQVQVGDLLGQVERTLALHQVLVILLSNAVKFSDPDSSVMVHVGMDVSSKLTQLIWTVRDTGCGIDDTHQSAIFERFYQVPAEESIGRSGHGIGLGLGLSIAKEIVELHGGSLTVDSQLGQGSEFTVRLPIRSEKSTN